MLEIVGEKPKEKWTWDGNENLIHFLYIYSRQSISALP